MPFRIRIQLAFVAIVYFSAFAWGVVFHHWFFVFAWLFAGVFLLDRYYPQFDLEAFTFFKGSPKHKRLALTFDDGPDPNVTPKLLEVLEQLQVKATFFILGKHAEKYPEIVKAIATHGHEIGSHGYSHQKYVHLSSAHIEKDLMKWEEVVLPLLSMKRPTFMRPPHGLKSFGARKILKKLGYQLAAWTRGVWDTDNPGVDVIVNRATRNVKPGEILLFHDGDGSGNYGDRTQTVAALPRVITVLKSQGFEFTSLENLRSETESPIRWGRLLFGFAWVFFLGLFVTRHINVADLIKAFTGMSVSWLLLSLFLDLACLFVKSQAWRQIVFPLKELPVGQSFSYYLIGAMLNHILPLRGGDIGRSDLLGRHHEVPRWQGYSTVLVEGLLNGLTLLPILAIALFFFPLRADIQQKLWYFSGAVLFLGAIAYFATLKFSSKWLEGFKVFKERKRFTYAFMFFLAAWVLYLASLTCILRAFHLHVSFWAAPIIAVFLAASMVIPAPPGRLGTFEATIWLALAIFDVSKETALGFGLVLHGSQSLPTMLWGSLALWHSQRNKVTKRNL